MIYSLGSAALIAGTGFDGPTLVQAAKRERHNSATANAGYRCMAPKYVWNFMI